jgi:hypothetical protein
MIKHDFIGPKGIITAFSIADSAAEATLIRDDLRKALGINGINLHSHAFAIESIKDLIEGGTGKPVAIESKLGISVYGGNPDEPYHNTIYLHALATSNKFHLPTLALQWSEAGRVSMDDNTPVREKSTDSTLRSINTGGNIKEHEVG